MFSHIFSRFVKGFSLIDLLKMAGKIKMISALEQVELLFQLRPTDLLFIHEIIFKAELSFILCRKVIDSYADQTDRTFIDLLKKGNCLAVDLDC